MIVFQLELDSNSRFVLQMSMIRPACRDGGRVLGGAPVEVAFRQAASGCLSGQLNDNDCIRLIIIIVQHMLINISGLFFIPP